MAKKDNKKKGVKKEVEIVKPVEEAVNEAPEVVGDAIVEDDVKIKPVEEVVNEVPEVVGDVINEDEEKQVDETEVVEEVVNESPEVVEEEEEKEITTEEIIDEYKNVTNEINNNLSNIYEENQLLETAEQELERLDSVEELVDNKIKQLEKNKDALKKYNNINFSRFWNGVSSGWDY